MKIWRRFGWIGQQMLWIMSESLLDRDCKRNSQVGLVKSFTVTLLVRFQLDFGVIYPVISSPPGLKPENNKKLYDLALNTYKSKRIAF